MADGKYKDKVGQKGGLFIKTLNRNEKCWCGNGRKYKKCHLDQDMRLDELQRQGCPVPDRHLIRSEAEIDGIRKACQFSKEVLDHVEGRIGPGITTEEIDTWVHIYTIARGAIPATLNYQGYPKSCCTSVNNVICHGIPDSTVLRSGDIINVDVTSILNGYYGDTSRMFLIGEVAEEARKLVQVAKECLYLGIEQIKPFNRIGDIAYAIEQYANQNGFSVVQEYGGHGIGLVFHDELFVPHYGKKDNGMVIVPDMVFTVEPMINAGSYKCIKLADEWTAVTEDGKLSAQWEHTVRVTYDGCEILTE